MDLCRIPNWGRVLGLSELSLPVKLETGESLLLPVLMLLCKGFH